MADFLLDAAAPLFIFYAIPRHNVQARRQTGKAPEHQEFAAFPVYNW